jgi:hypothetical protein
MRDRKKFFAAPCPLSKVRASVAPDTPMLVPPKGPAWVGKQMLSLTLAGAAQSKTDPRCEKWTPWPDKLGVAVRRRLPPC